MNPPPTSTFGGWEWNYYPSLPPCFPTGWRGNSEPPHPARFLLQWWRRGFEHRPRTHFRSVGKELPPFRTRRRRGLNPRPPGWWAGSENPSCFPTGWTVDSEPSPHNLLGSFRSGGCAHVPTRAWVAGRELLPFRTRRRGSNPRRPLRKEPGRVWGGSSTPPQIRAGRGIVSTPYHPLEVGGRGRFEPPAAKGTRQGVGWF